MTFFSEINILSLQKSIPVLSTKIHEIFGRMLNDDTKSHNSVTGKLVALGSGHMFSDKYIDKEENELVRRIIFALLSSPDSIQLHQIDAEDPDVSINKLVLHFNIIREENLDL